MGKQLQIVVSEVPTGIEPTQKQVAQRKKFARVATEVAEEMKNTKLRGAARVRAFNARVSQRLREQG